jgi:hypothetical protein
MARQFSMEFAACNGAQVRPTDLAPTIDLSDASR